MGVDAFTLREWKRCAMMSATAPARRGKAVIAAGPQLITNTARIGVPGYPVIERTEAVLVDAYAVYVPIVLRRW